MNIAGADLTLLLGPTASGKTDVAMALQDALGGTDAVALISVDATMVYRGMDIGSAKPSAQELAAHPHALIDIRDPEMSYTAADFVADADLEVRAARAAGRHPVLVGGSMLYAKRFLEGIATLPAGDDALRARLEVEFAEDDGAALHRELQGLDPSAAAVIAPRNRQRLIRAVEVLRLTNKPLSQHWAEQGDTSLMARLGLTHRSFALYPEARAELHARIAERFDLMLERGFLDEVAGLMARPGLSADLPSMRSVGYRQAWQHLSGAIDQGQMRADAVTATRRLAKRQFTWLRSWPDIVRIEPHGSPSEIARQIGRA